MARTSAAVAAAAAAAAVSRAMQASIESLVTETPTVNLLRLKLVRFIWYFISRIIFAYCNAPAQAENKFGGSGYQAPASLHSRMPDVNVSSSLQENPSSFSFSPGQWVDFQVPGLQAVGGYSICSTPSQLQQTGTLDLCVKRSGHPCAQWVHTEAAPGKQV
jgi:hypothetical protein